MPKPAHATKPARHTRSAAIDVAGIEAPVEVRRHASARRLTLRVSQTRRAVIVTVPLRCRIDEAGQFLHRNLDWVRERLGSMPAMIPFTDGAVVPLRGVRHRLVFAPPRRGETSVQSSRDINGDAILIVRGAPEHCARRLRDWLTEQARRDIGERVTFHARQLNLRPTRLSLRDQASRWGSCSSTGVLSFSWRLIMAPPHVLDYAAAHEVAHLAEMNHGPRFWALVHKAIPDFSAAKTWLHQHGTELHRYGASRETGRTPAREC